MEEGVLPPIKVPKLNGGEETTYGQVLIYAVASCSVGAEVMTWQMEEKYFWITNQRFSSTKSNNSECNKFNCP